MFNKEKMQPTSFPPGMKMVFEIGKYDLSVVNNKMSYGNKQGLFEISVYKDNNQIELPGITDPGDTVKGFLTADDVNAIIKKMTAITGVEPTIKES
tara:strand:+ start:1753 stop:2040 length:288 start_codon:yes stop_codon:yes gene_type:complete